jgi:serine/threonine protein phosphatase PrpC
MVLDQHQFSWYCLGATVPGASHTRRGLTNQDAIRCWPNSPRSLPTDTSGLPLIVAISDGHGSAKSFRSQWGAELAVEIAIAETQSFFRLDTPATPTPAAIDSALVNPTSVDPASAISESAVQEQAKSEQASDQEPALQEQANFAFISDEAKRRLPQVLVSKWQAAVAQHRQQHPFTEAEWQQLEIAGAASARPLIEQEHSTLAYGATLLLVLVTELFILYLQLGDGDILCVDAEGNVSQPFAKDARLIANETTSLCMDKAWQDIQVRLLPYSDHPPVLILLATDGYANSFGSTTDFLEIGREYRALIADRGQAELKQQLKKFLQDTSQSGSGDDITLGVIRRIEEGDKDYLTTTVKTLKGRVERQAESQEVLMTQSEKKFSNLDQAMQTLVESDRDRWRVIKKLQNRIAIAFLMSLISLILGGLGLAVALYSLWHPKVVKTSPENPTLVPQSSPLPKPSAAISPPTPTAPTSPAVPQASSPSPPAQPTAGASASLSPTSSPSNPPLPTPSQSQGKKP